MDDVVAARQALQNENTRAGDRQHDNNTGNADNQGLREQSAFERDPDDLEAGVEVVHQRGNNRDQQQ